MTHAGRAAGYGVMLGLAAGCAPEESPAARGAETRAAAWFREEARERGLVFDHVSGFRERYLMPEIMCGGAALFDADQDGDLDAYLVQAGSLYVASSERPPNRLFLNDGAGRFRDATEGSGADDRGYGMGVACGDYDNDGRTDLYVTNLGRDALLKNLGGGRFEDRSEAAGVADSAWGSSAAFFDYDRDGDLDLFVCTYLEWSLEKEKTCLNHVLGGHDYCSPQEYAAPAQDVLYRNEGDGTFADVSAQAGIAALKGTGLGVACGDFDGDGLEDVFVANDGMPNRLWRNRGDGTFADMALERGCAFDADGRAAAGMGVAAGDADQDGDLDLLVCNLRNESDSFFRNDGRFFSNVTAVSGLGGTSRPFTRFGAGFCDFDNDGLADLYVANGRVVRHADPFDERDVYAEPGLVFQGTAPGRFAERLPRGGTERLLVATGRAAAFGDVDQDGGIDVVVVNKDGPAHLLMNAVPARGHWLLARVQDEHGRDAIGATVTLVAGGRTRRAEVRAAYSYQASSDPRVHFGLGAATRAEQVEVRWPDGETQSFGALEADRVVTLRRAAR